MIEGGKNALGLKGFPTPNEAPDDLAYLVFYFPNSADWPQLLLGALEPLIYEYNWYLWGEMSADESANRWREIIDQAPYNLLPAEVGTPYWDDEDGEDANDIAPRDDQSWYGLIFDNGGVLEWREQVGLWAITALVALAATPAAAIAFYPIAKRFAISFKTGDFGGVIRAFIDSTEVGRVDTYAPSGGVGQMNIQIPAPAMGLRALDVDPPVLWLVMGDDSNPAVVGTPNIQILRKRLDENEVYPVSMRYDEISDQIQTDYDGDDVWQDNSGLDFRHNTTYQFPPIVADDPACQAAANMSRWVSDFLNEVTTTLSWATTAESALTTIMGGIALAFPEVAAVGVLAFLGLDLATTLFSAGITAIQAAFDNDTLDTMTCIFFCEIEPDGTVTAGDLGAINAAITDQIGGLAALVMSGMFLLVGEVGVTNWGARGDAPADCDECECDWCVDFDLADGDFGFGTITDAWGVHAIYEDSFGWKAHLNAMTSPTSETATFFAVDRLLPNSHYTKIELTCVWEYGDISVFQSPVIWIFDGIELVNTTSDFDGVVTWEGDRNTTGAHLGIDAIMGYNNVHGLAGGRFDFTHIHLEGKGNCPYPDLCNC